MIALDLDFVGSLAPTTKLTTAVNDTHDVPFGRLPRLERLRIQGKADETELVDDDEDAAEGEGDKNDKPQSRAEKEKRKMRGKGKSVKRYLRKQRKNVIDPTAVAIRAKLEKQREEKRVAKAIEKGQMEARQPSALDRFRRP